MTTIAQAAADTASLVNESGTLQSTAVANGMDAMAFAHSSILPHRVPVKDITNRAQIQARLRHSAKQAGSFARRPKALGQALWASVQRDYQRIINPVSTRNNLFDWAQQHVGTDESKISTQRTEPRPPVQRAAVNTGKRLVWGGAALVAPLSSGLSFGMIAPLTAGHYGLHAWVKPAKTKLGKACRWTAGVPAAMIGAPVLAASGFAAGVAGGVIASPYLAYKLGADSVKRGMKRDDMARNGSFAKSPDSNLLNPATGRSELTASGAQDSTPDINNIKSHLVAADGFEPPTKGL
jgi:hypothetical protein